MMWFHRTTCYFYFEKLYYQDKEESHLSHVYGVVPPGPNGIENSFQSFS